MSMVLREGGLLAATGIAIGVAPLDLATFVLVPVSFAAVALIASFIPSRAASRIDPTIALRHE